jgi:hypothetical protein
MWLISIMSTQEMLLSEIKNQAGPVLREPCHYLQVVSCSLGLSAAFSLSAWLLRHLDKTSDSNQDTPDKKL